MRKEDFRPNKNRLLVEQCKAETKTIGGMYIPDSVQEKPQLATVIAYGNECKNHYEIGMTVVIPKYGATTLPIDGVDFLIVKEDDILGMIYENNL